MSDTAAGATPEQQAEAAAQWNAMNAEYERGRAEEREACARLAEQHRATYYIHGITPTGQPGIRHSFADLIRARSQP